MKVWIKYFIGIVLGIICALFLPASSVKAAEILSFLTDLFIRIGRYIVVPLVFASGIVAVNKLRSSKMIGKTVLWTFLIIVVSSLFLTFMGIISIVLFRLPRIPIIGDTTSEVVSIDVKSLILSLFPNSAYESLVQGTFIGAAFLFAFFVGWSSASMNETNTFKPITMLVDSLSQLFYNIASFFTEILSVLSVAIMCYWAFTYKSTLSSGTYTPMMIMFMIDFIVIACIIYPLIVRYVCHDPHPYRVLYASLAPFMLSFISGDSNLALGISTLHGKESLGIRRRISGFTYPLFSIFARGGSALVASISFIIIMYSYSSLELKLGQIMIIFLIAFGASFLLGGLPTGGAFVLLTVICQKYGQGFESSYLLLKPTAFIICSFATLIDTATAMFGSYIVASKTKMIEYHSIKNFI
ncbi:MAG: dicarboxylate/amino acid:cation symporter [Treponema sp.]|nr:dicarboxylate/amino acid:cation symporter [Treponema sp.]